MAQRRPIASHPAFVPLLALWFAALFGLGVAVLPETVLAGLLNAASLSQFVASDWSGRLIASVAASLLGGLIGYGFAQVLARRSARDPRPVYADPQAEAGSVEESGPTRRPLRVREELEASLSSGIASHADDDAAPLGDRAGATSAQHLAVASEEGFMILAPQASRRHLRQNDLDALLSQFDDAMTAFRADDSDRPGTPDQGGTPDPVRTFVERQTGTVQARDAHPTSAARAAIDHQAELRAALDKLARAKGSAV